MSSPTPERLDIPGPGPCSQVSPPTSKGSPPGSSVVVDGSGELYLVAGRPVSGPRWSVFLLGDWGASGAPVRHQQGLRVTQDPGHASRTFDTSSGAFRASPPHLVLRVAQTHVESHGIQRPFSWSNLGGILRALHLSRNGPQKYIWLGRFWRIHERPKLPPNTLSEAARNPA